MNEVKPIDIELAVRSLGLPFSYCIERIPEYSPRERLWMEIAKIPPAPALMTMAFHFYCTPEVKAYLSEMESRYKIWLSLREQMETRLSALDD